MLVIIKVLGSRVIGPDIDGGGDKAEWSGGSRKALNFCISCRHD